MPESCGCRIEPIQEAGGQYQNTPQTQFARQARYSQMLADPMAGYRINFCPLHAHAEALAAHLQVALDELQEIANAIPRSWAVEAARDILRAVRGEAAPR